jgi:site-specific DNA-methyltransferase (adenine-specific)
MGGGGVLRVLKPGGHLLAFGGTRTYHRLACAIEDAGFEIRDSITWIYGSGFPKSHNLDGEWQGWGTALKPASEPIVVARKPFPGTVAQNVTMHGTGALNIDGCRVAGVVPTVPQAQFDGSNNSASEGRSGRFVAG